MAISLQDIQKSNNDRTPLVVFHGPPGIGKTTLAAGAPSVVFLRTEDGLGNLGVDTFPEITSYASLMEGLASLYQTDDHDYKAVVIDSLSALEPMIWQQVAKDKDKDNIESIGYGKGYIYAMDLWREILDACKGLSRLGIMPILISHTDIVKFESPEVDAYDRYQIKLHKKAFQYLCEQADIIGFCNYPVHIKKSSQDDKKGRGIKAGGRTLHLIDSPAFVAKNRYSLPASIPLIWDEFQSVLEEATSNKKQ